MTACAEIVGVVGAGVMGRGVAQLFAQSGQVVRLFDAKPGAAQAARDFALQMIDRQARKGALDAAKAASAAERLIAVEALEDLSSSTVVIEAIIEDLAAKQDVLGQLETVVAPTTILASNTSSLTISAIAAGRKNPARIAGLHFFNPAPLMKVVEVIPGLRTAPETTARLSALVRLTGHVPVTAADQPGFLINHAGRALYTEGFRILEEGVADHAAVDRVVRESCGFRMGPFELLDLTGLDVSGAVMNSIYAQFQHDPRYRPSSLIGPRVAAGLFGQKTGEGFYVYADGLRRDVPEPEPPPARAGKVWLAGEDAALAARLEASGARIAASCEDADVVLVQPWGQDVATVVAARDLPAERTVALDPMIPPERRQVLMTSPATTPEAVSLAHGWLAAGGCAVSVIADSPGFIAQRVLAMIVNTGCEIAQRAIAAPAGIDAAVRIGLGYPMGPLELGDAIGPHRIHEILLQMQAATGDPRYRPSLWLRRRALLGQSLTRL